MSHKDKNIAFVCQPYHRGGVTRWMVDMAVEYQRQGFNTYFVTVNPKKPFISAGKAETIIQLLKTTGYQGTLVTQNVDYVFELASNDYKASIYQKLIASRIPQNTPIILSDDYAVWQGSCSVATDYKIIAVIHCSVSEFYYTQAKLFKEQLSGIVAVSKRCFNKLDVVDLNRVLMQPCGIPMRKLSKSIPMQRPGLLKPTLRIAWAGRMENNQKRITDLVLIAEQLKQKDLKFTFDIIGEGGDKEALIAEVDAKGLATHFKFHGWQSKKFIEETLQAAQLYLLPSNYEGYPVAVMEAFANGCVVISSRVSGIEDLEQEPDTAAVLKVFEIGDIQQASLYIEEMQEADFVTLAQKSKEVAFKYFSIETCAANYQNFVENLPHNTVTKNSVINLNKTKEVLRAVIRLFKYKITH